MSLTGTWDLTNSPGCLGIQPQRFTVSIPPHCWVCRHRTSLFTVFSCVFAGDQPQVLKHFINWAISVSKVTDHFHHHHHHHHHHHYHHHHHHHHRLRMESHCWLGARREPWLPGERCLPIESNLTRQQKQQHPLYGSVKKTNPSSWRKKPEKMRTSRAPKGTQLFLLCLL